jgi:hypothetical protein
VRRRLEDRGLRDQQTQEKTLNGVHIPGSHTAPWAPPEPIEGAAADPSADVCEFGRVIAFLLTGSPKKADIAAVPESRQGILAPCVDDEPERHPTAVSVRLQLDELVLAK